MSLSSTIVRIACIVFCIYRVRPVSRLSIYLDTFLVKRFSIYRKFLFQFEKVVHSCCRYLNQGSQTREPHKALSRATFGPRCFMGIFKQLTFAYSPVFKSARLESERVPSSLSEQRTRMNCDRRNSWKWFASYLSQEVRCKSCF